jgi:hypothetical protein
MLFGDIDETVSYVLGVNYYSDNLNKVGLIIVKILNKLESYHIQRALCMKYLNDIDAGVRLNGRFFYKLNNMQAEGDTELNKVIANILGPYSPVNEPLAPQIIPRSGPAGFFETIITEITYLNIDPTRTRGAKT